MESLNITAQETKEVKYKMIFADGRLQKIYVEESGQERRFYAITSKQQDQKLTYSVFREIVSHICRVNPESIVELKEKLRGDTEFTKVLQETLMRIFDQYKNLIIL